MTGVCVHGRSRGGSALRAARSVRRPERAPGVRVSRSATPHPEGSRCGDRRRRPTRGGGTGTPERESEGGRRGTRERGGPGPGREVGARSAGGRGEQVRVVPCGGGDSGIPLRGAGGCRVDGRARRWRGQEGAAWLSLLADGFRRTPRGARVARSNLAYTLPRLPGDCPAAWGAPARVRYFARRRVEDIARREQHLEVLARLCADAAAARWRELRDKVTPSNTQQPLPSRRPYRSSPRSASQS
jgi:hypothetical protein